MKLSKTILFSTLLAALVGCIFTFFISIQLFALRRSFEMAHYERQVSDRASQLYALATDPDSLPPEPRLVSQWKSAYGEAGSLIAKSLSMVRTEQEKKSLLSMQKDLHQAALYLKQSVDPVLQMNLASASFFAMREKIKLGAASIRYLADQLAGDHEDAARSQLHVSLVITALFLFSVLGFTTVAILWSHYHFFLPLKALQFEAEKISSGDFNHRLDSSREDEIGDLSKTLTRMTDHLLELQKRIAQEAQEKLQAQHELLDIQEDERKRMGQDLHDGITQRLVGLGFMSQLIEKKISEKKSVEAEELRHLTEEIKKTLEETRQMAHSFYPVDLQHCGLSSALRNLAQTFSSTFRIQCNFVCHEENILKDPDVEAHLYRIAQEALHNAVRHGSAKDIRIEYGKRHESAYLFIADNGNGFSPGNEGIQRGIGFRSMYYRAAIIHGTISIETRKNRGTRITIRCPLKLPHPHPEIKAAHHVDFNPKRDPFS